MRVAPPSCAALQLRACDKQEWVGSAMRIAQLAAPFESEPAGG
jgi:hypothetical protein